MTLQEFEKRYTYDRINDKLGEGGFGKVFKAYDNYLDKYVALKISEVPAIESMRLKYEVETVTKLPPHPNIARYEECHTFSTLDGEKDIGVLQYYEAGNLNQLLKTAQLSFEQKESLLKQILDGVEFLHVNKIIHRDLKPQNVLIVRRGDQLIPKITDFGISKKLDIDKSSAFSNSISGVGTLAFTSPEQLSAREIRKNTDLWSFGILAYRIMAGQLPFTPGEHEITSESGRQEIFRQIISGDLPNGIDNIPEPWQKVIRRCLVNNPALRAKDVQELRDIMDGKRTAEKPRVKQETPSEQDNDKTQLDFHKGDESRIESKENKPLTPLSNNKDTKPASRKQLLIFSTIIFASLLLILLFKNWQPSTQPELQVQNIETNSTDPPTVRDIHNNMVYVEGGTFSMGCTAEQGSDCYDDEKPAHQVTLSGYYIGKTEVMQGQWDAIMGMNIGHDDWTTKYGLGDNYPAYNVSWDDIQQFLAKLNSMQTQYTYRLPTEAEWEFAARGGIKSRGYKYSGSHNAGEVAWYNENSGSKSHPVGQKGGNELGLYDMSGNVWEWCQDWFGSYSINAQTNPKGPSTGSGRVVRGGSLNYDARNLRVTNRSYCSPFIRDGSLGFRLACSPR